MYFMTSKMCRVTIKQKVVKCFNLNTCEWTYLNHYFK